jgi:hypothetical protein
MSPFFKKQKASNAQQTIELWCIKRVFPDKAIRICEDVVFGQYRCAKRIPFCYSDIDPADGVINVLSNRRTGKLGLNRDSDGARAADEGLDFSDVDGAALVDDFGAEDRVG